MADLQKTVEIVFGGRNDLSKVIGDVERSLSNINSATQPFADLSKDVLSAEAAVVALGVAFAGLSIQQAGQFGDQFAEISTLITDNAADLGGYKTQILDYATTSTQSLESITGAVYSAISAGVDYSDALGIMTAAEQLAVAGKSDLNSTLVAMASTMNAYGASTDQAADYSDVFFTAVKQGQTTIPELAAGLAQVTSTAAAAEVPFDDLSAAIAALTASGLPTSQAITSIKAALSNIVKPSSDAKAAAAELGIEFNTTALKTQGLSGFMNMLWEATGGNIDTMSRLFGSTEALTGVMTLAGDKSGIFAQAMQEMETRSGATAVAFEKMVDNFELNNQKLVNNLQVVLVGVGGQLLDEYGGLVDALIKTLQGVGTALDNGSLDGLINIFESALTDITGLLNSAAQNLPAALSGIDWSGLEQSFDNLKGSIGEAFKTIFGDVNLNSVEGLQSAIQTVVDVLAGLTNVSAGVVQGLQPLFEGVRFLAEKFTEADQSGQEFAGNILGIGTSVNQITGLLSGATSTVGGLSNALLLLGGSSVINAITGLINTLGGPGSGLVGAIGKLGAIGAAGGAGYAFGTWLNGQINTAVQSLTGGENDSLGGLIYDWINGDSSKIDAAMTTVESQLQRPISKIEDDLTPAARAFVDKVRGNAEDFSAIQWELDPQGNILGTVTTLATETDAKFQELKGYYESLGNSPKIAAAMAQLELQTQRIPSAVSKAKDDTKVKAEELLVELEKIASNERLKTFEISAELNIANLEAESKKAIAIIDGIGTSITSTGDLLGNLTGSFGDLSPTDLAARRTIDDLIDDENKRRDEVFKQQKELTKVQIDLENEKLSRLQNGDAIIKISGDGLAPELEAFMWKILERIQIEAAADQAEFLLGV